MMGASNDFYNFVMDSYFVFSRDDETTLKASWEMYKVYCADAKVPHPDSQRIFKEELKNYFKEYEEEPDSKGRMKNIYRKFKKEIFESEKKSESKKKKCSSCR